MIKQEFGRLTVLEQPYTVGKYTFAECLCSCGNTVIVRVDHLKSGRTTSCGCFRKSVSAKRLTKHGECGTAIYGVWSGMKQRCNDPGCRIYPRYGGRGITVCQEWIDAFEVFRDWALANGYARGLEIDRIDNDGNYEPSNCRFVDRRTNMRNTSTARMVTAFGETKCVTAWADDQRCKTTLSNLFNRIHDLEWSPEMAVSTPTRRCAKR